MPTGRLLSVNMVTTCSASWEKMAFQLVFACFVRSENMYKCVFSSKYHSYIDSTHIGSSPILRLLILP